jgi:hypothetical protein
VKCPDGHRWWECRHPELAMPGIGLALMAVGLLHIIIAFALVVR